MDFYERLRNLSPKKYQELVEQTALIGDPQEVFAYINAMPICCQESPGWRQIDYEVRIDSRFLILCHRKNLAGRMTDQIQTFYVSACENGGYYWFGINHEGGFIVNSKSALDLYQRLLALRPGSFRPIPDTRTINIYDNRNLSIDDQNVTVWRKTLLNKIKTLQLIPLKNIRACYQTYYVDSDGNSYYLHLRMKDGTEQKIVGRDNLCCFQIAQRLKAVIPELIYEFPTSRD